MTKVLSIENIGKEYRLGLVGARSFRDDFLRWRRGKQPAPMDKVASSLWALRNINFQVEKGVALGLIGRNGAGKSTLLKLLSQITAPTEGVIRVKGRIASLLEVGTGFHPELTGRENVFLNGMILGMSRTEIHRKFDEIVDFSGVEKFIDTPVKHYSSGMYVRLAFAVAAHLEPEILIVDEVLAVGDAEFQRKCLGKMGSVVEGEGRTVLFVSHNLGAVQQLCSEAMVLNGGQISMIGPVNKAVEHYMNIALHQQGERIWDVRDQPGNGIVRLAAIRFRDQYGEIVSQFDVRSLVQIEVDYSVRQPGHQIGVVLELLSTGTPIMVAFDDYVRQPWNQQSPRSTGMYRTIFKIPGDLLNEGQVSINLRLFSPPELPNENPHVRLLDVIQFMVNDRMDTGGVRGYYPYYWGSPTVRPHFDVMTEKVSDKILGTT